jgi:hypothetical protein
MQDASASQSDNQYSRAKELHSAIGHSSNEKRPRKSRATKVTERVVPSQAPESKSNINAQYYSTSKYPAYNESNSPNSQVRNAVAPNDTEMTPLPIPPVRYL